MLATGSRAVGAADPRARTARGVFAFRSLADCARSAPPPRGAQRAVVIGGGLLGLEAARGLRERGVAVTVVHLADRLMEQQLDPLAARLLERRIRALGIDVLCGRAHRARRRRRDDGVALADGDELPADLVVVATGIRPEVALARDAGLEVGRGILVDDELRTSAPGRVGRRRVRRAPRHGLRAVGAAARAGARGRRRDRRAARTRSTARSRPRR